MIFRHNFSITNEWLIVDVAVWGIVALLLHILIPSYVYVMVNKRKNMCFEIISCKRKYSDGMRPPWGGGG